MNTRQILDHFYRTCAWVDPQTTVDRVIFGDAEKPVRTVLTTWISSMAACREAARRGVDLLITHEPTFWSHGNERVNPDDSTALAKAQVLEEAGLTVLRLHDSWDLFPEIGMPFAWAQFLGIPTPPVAISANRYQHRYDIAPLPAGEFAQQAAEKTAQLNEPVLQFAGDPERIISRIGLNTGCACDTWEYERLGCDLFIVCDDGSSYWHSIRHAVDGHYPVLRANHGTSEEPGMATLTGYLQTTFPELQVEHLPYAGSYVPVGQVPVNTIRP